jgi:hypothetical protein
MHSKDYTGSDMSLGDIVVVSLEECMFLCEKLPVCVAWAVNSDNGRCYLKNSIPKLNASTSNVYTGSCA